MPPQAPEDMDSESILAAATHIAQLCEMIRAIGASMQTSEIETIHVKYHTALKRCLEDANRFAYSARTALTDSLIEKGAFVAKRKRKDEK